MTAMISHDALFISRSPLCWICTGDTNGDELTFQVFRSASYENATLAMRNLLDQMRRSAIKLCNAAMSSAPPHTTLLIFSSGSPGTCWARSALTPAVVITTAPAIIKSRPATRLASYVSADGDRRFQSDGGNRHRAKARRARDPLLRYRSLCGISCLYAGNSDVEDKT